MKLTRRGLLFGTGAAGGLLLAWALMPRHFFPPLEPGQGEFAFDAWLTIGKNGVVTVAVPQLEMGQGITTLIPQIVAQELGADWRQVAVAPAPVSGAYANVPLAARWAELWMPAFAGIAEGEDSFLARRWAEANDFTATADGTSLAAYELTAREAAASARAMLAKAAADRWGVGWEECEAEGGFILHDKRRLSFAELAEAASDYSPPDPPVLRAIQPPERPGEFPAGAPLAFPRLDLPAKVDGSLTFAGDVRLPGMVFAAIRHAPIGEARLGHYNAGAAKGIAGFERLVAGDSWLAAMASNWWAAERALAAIAPRFAGSNRADSTRIGKALDEALHFGDAHRVAKVGDPDAYLGGPLEYVCKYRVAPAFHAPVETASATARFADGRLELWVASQAPQALRRAAADALGIGLGKVVLYPVAAGGSFDARLEHAHAVEAALIAREVGKPVQLTWSRWQEALAVPPRTPVRAVLGARTTPDGMLAALKTRIAVPASAREMGARLFGGDGPQEALAAQDHGDPLAVEGATPPYAIDHLVVEHVPARIPLPTGRMRGNAHGYTCFFTETFVDELAHRAGHEPMSYRIAMLGSDPRLAQCLQHAATLAEWNGGASGSGQGIACHRMTLGSRFGRIALVANASQSEEGIRVDKFSAVADIGRIVNVDIARQQIEGGLVFGLGLALGAAARYERGLPVNGRLGAMGLPLLANSPEIEVDFLESEAEPFDPGELGVAVVAPALANALFSVTGTRIRTLPLSGEGT